MDQPIACTLGAAQSKERTAELAALAERALRSRQETADGERLVFADSAEIERELSSMIDAESSCCAFLRMDLGAATFLDAASHDARSRCADCSKRVHVARRAGAAWALPPLC